jgi:DnaJ homologue, subfamily C, member 28, conserved domain
VTQRKPPGVTWESWIDRQIRRAQERGEFHHLPGEGQPIPDLDKRFDELRWVKDKLVREELSYMSPSVALRKQVHDAVQAASRAESETEVRQLIAEINKKIRDANRKGIRGPSLMLMPFAPDRVVREWRRRRSKPGCEREA